MTFDPSKVDSKMKKEVVVLESQEGHTSGVEGGGGDVSGPLGNSRLTLTSKETVLSFRTDVVDVSIQVDFPADVITYDSDDETMGRKRFSAFRTKKGGTCTPLYSKEDIREQYCITNKQLHVLETAQARKLFGCIPNQDWKSCHRASLLSSCLRKTKSASDENLAGIRPMDAKPLAWEPLPPEMQRPTPKALSASSTATVVIVDGGGNCGGNEVPSQVQHHPTLRGLHHHNVKSLRQSFDEELANAVLRRRAKLLGSDTATDSGEAISASSSSINPNKRHTWAVEGTVVVRQKPETSSDVSEDGNLLSSSGNRPTLLRLRSQDSEASIGSEAPSIESQEGLSGGKRFAMTMPNTPDLSHGSARRQAKTPDVILDERRQKHVSFDCAALMRSHPTISSMSGSESLRLEALTSPPMRRFDNTRTSPDRNKSQERLLDIGTTTKKNYDYHHHHHHHHYSRRRLGSVRSLDFMTGWSPKIHPAVVLTTTKSRKPMKTQATQTETATAAAQKISIPAPVLAYLTLSPRAHNAQELPSQGRIFINGKRLVKSRSDSEYKIVDDSDLKMTVIHLDDTALLAKKRVATRTRSSPLAGRRRTQKEIMVTFKPQEFTKNANRKQLIGGNGQNGKHHKLVKTISEGSVLVRQQRLSTYEIGDDGTSEGDYLADETIPKTRERSESDPLLLETDIDDSCTGKLDVKEQRPRSFSEAVTLDEKDSMAFPGQNIMVTSANHSQTDRDAEGEEEEEEEQDDVSEEAFTDPKSFHVKVSEKTSLETTSRGGESEGGGSQYHSLTDPSTGSTTPSPLMNLKKDSSDPQQELRRSWHSRLRDKDSSDSGSKGGGGGSTDEAELSERSVPTSSSCDIDKTIAYSSDTEFGSIKSEDSHTLMDAPREFTPPLSQFGIVKTDQRHRNKVVVIKGVLKDTLASPESESSGRNVSMNLSAQHKTELSHTDSNKSELEGGGSETSEDYHTATEHSYAEPLERWNGAVRTSPTKPYEPQVQKFGKLQQRPPMLSASLLEERVEMRVGDFSEVPSQEFPQLHNLPSPRSPNASSLSIESSTSGSYTIESGASEGESSRDSTRKHSTSTVGDSDKELENIFSSKGDIFESGEQRDGGKAPLMGEHDDEDDETSLTPTPDVFLKDPDSSRHLSVSNVTERKLSSTGGDTSVEEFTCTTEKSLSDDSGTKSSEVVESSYNFKEIRLKFERMLDKRQGFADERDRPSSVDTTEASSSLSSDTKPPIKKKPDILIAKAKSRPTGFGQKLERESFTKKEQHDGGGGIKSCSPENGRSLIANKKHHNNGHRKEYRRAISESPECSSHHSASMEMPRSVSDVRVTTREDGGGRYVGGGAKSKRGHVEGTEGPKGGGKKHKSRSQDKDHGKQKQNRSSIATSSDDTRSKRSEEEEDTSRGVFCSSDPIPIGTSMSSSRDDMSDVICGNRIRADSSAESDRNSVRKSSSSRTPDSGDDSIEVRKRTSSGADNVLKSGVTIVSEIMKNDNSGVGVGGSTKRRSASSSSFPFEETRDHGGRKRRERSLPGSTERLEERRSSELLSTSLPERQMELFEMSKMLCSECGEKIRKIHGHEHEEDERFLHDVSDSKMQGITTTTAATTSSTSGVVDGASKQQHGAKGKNISSDSGPYPIVTKGGGSGQSSTESLLRRCSPAAVDSPGLSGSSLSWTEGSQYLSTHDVAHEEEDEDVGVYAESYRASAWIYIGENEELIVWKGGPDGTNDKTDEDVGSMSNSPSVATTAAAAAVVTSAAASSSSSLSNPSDVASLHRTDSLESTASEKEFRRKYQAITHRMIHRKSSVEMYKRLSNRTFECDKTVIVQRKSGEFGFRIHGSRPVVVSAIEPGTPAETSGLEVGDIVIAVNGVNVLDASHTEVVKIAHTGSETLRMDVARTCHVLTPSASDAESQKPVHRGFLYKLTGGVGGVGLGRKWCRRWFVLKKDHCLYYYKTETSKEPLGAVMLLNYSVSRASEVGRSFAFRVIKYGAASYCFAAENEDEMNTWATLINEASNCASQSDPWIEVSSRNVQLPALSIHNPDCHGYLAKLGQRWKTWKRRYCVLKDACVYFYHDLSSVTSLGVAHLHGYRVQSCSVSGKKHAFEVIPPELKMRHFYFYADNETDRKRWLAALEYSIDRWIKVG